MNTIARCVEKVIAGGYNPATAEAIVRITIAAIDAQPSASPDVDVMERVAALRDCDRPELPLLQQWQVNQVARALRQYGDDRAQQAQTAASPGADVTNPHDLWRDLCEKDDRTSPEEYPDMALITEDELVSLLQQYGDEREAAARPQAGTEARERASTIWNKARAYGWKGFTGHYHVCLESVVASEIQAYGDERAAALQEAISEAYQVVGVLSHSTATFDHPDVIRALDNLSAAADGKPVPHDDLLPFPKQLIRPDIEAYGDERAREAREVAVEEFESARMANYDVFAASIRKLAEKSTIWREARAAAIEEAARVADSRSAWAEAKITEDDNGQFGTYANACDDCAEMIRALTPKPGSET